MELIYLFFSLVIPLMPLITGHMFSYGPAYGTLLLVSVQLFLGVSLKTFITYFSITSNDLPWITRTDNYYEDGLIYTFLFSALICIGYLVARRTFFHVGTGYPNLSSKPNPRAWKVISILILSVIMNIFIIYLLSVFRGIKFSSIVQFIADFNAGKVSRIEGETNFGNTFAAFTLFLSISELTLVSFPFISSGILLNTGVTVSVILILTQSLIRGKRDLLVALLLNIIYIIVFKKSVFRSFKRKKLNNLTILSIIIVAFISSVVFLLITQLRGGSDISFQQAIKDISRPILYSTYFTDINIISTIIYRMKSLSFFYGSSYADFITALIPRFLWENKPAISLGLYVKSQILNLPGTIGGVPPTFPGEAFINFGWLGILVALFYGYFLYFYEIYLLKSGRVGTILYIALMHSVTWSMMQSSFSIVLTGIIGKCIVFIPLLLFMTAGKYKLDS